MGRGCDGTVQAPALLQRSSSWSLDRLKSMSSVKDDLLVLKHLWFSKASGADHAARLESFYGPQAAACECCGRATRAGVAPLWPRVPRCARSLASCAPLNASFPPLASPALPADDAFRSRFLWGRKPMLAACAARLQDRDDLVWVDLGGGTGVSVLCGGALLACAKGPPPSRARGS